NQAKDVVANKANAAKDKLHEGAQNVKNNAGKAGELSFVVMQKLVEIS
ncbi:unnamed protein product, partial [Rotaria socialis]